MLQPADRSNQGMGGQTDLRIVDAAEHGQGTATQEQAPNTVSFDEIALAEASISGDDRAFEELYTHYFPKVRNFCIRKIGNRELAEDIAQEAFARAFKRIGAFGGPKNFGGWVSTIAANLCTDHLRRKKNTPISFEQMDQDPSFEIDPIKDIAKKDTGQIVRSALERLEPRHQEALMMHEVKGMSCAAVGERLGISEVAAESLLARARRRLRKEITAKAVPADLFSFGGVGLAFAGGYRRFKAGAARRLQGAQASAARAMDAVGLSAMPAVDATKAFVVAASAALAVSAASAAISPAPPAPAPTTETATVQQPISPDGDPGSARGKGGLAPGASVDLDVTADEKSGELGGSASITAPDAPGAGEVGSDISVGVDDLLGNPTADAQVILRDPAGNPILDSGKHSVTAP